MRAKEISQRLNTYVIKIKLPQKGYSIMMDTTVQARTPEMARRMIHNLYGSKTALVGQPKLVKP